MVYSCRNNLQVALLYDRSDAIALDTLLSNFLKSEANEFDYRYNVIETDGKTYARCFGGQGSDVMVFMELVDRPTDKEAFRMALSSVVNTLAAPDAESLIDRHRAFLLINVQHGVMPESPQLQQLLSQLDMPKAGQSPALYLERLRVLGLLSAMATEISEPTLAHWTHSDVLSKPAATRELMLSPGPTPLHIHPLPFRAEGTTQDQGIAGLVTFGAAGFIGREIRVRPSEVAWPTVFEHALVFIRIAMAKNGYVIPDGDTFGDEGRTFSYRVHHAAEPMVNAGVPIPCFELEPLLNAEQDFQSPAYVPPDEVVDVDRPQRQFGNFNSREGMRLVAEWREKRRTAEAVGAQFEVRATPGAKIDGGQRSLLGWVSRKLGR